MDKNSRVNIISLLIIANILIWLLGVYLFINLDDNEYIDNNTFYLFTLFSIENILMFYYAKKTREPFIFLLASVTLVFYLMRIVTLEFNTYSPTLFLISEFHPADLNYATMYIMLCNIAIFIGLTLPKEKITYERIQIIGHEKVNCRKVIIISIIAFIIGFTQFLPKEQIGRLAMFIQAMFFRVDIIMLLTITFFVVYNKVVSKQNKYIIMTLIISFILLQSLTGNRSAILTLLVFALVASLSAKPTISISKRLIIWSPLIIMIAILFFIYGTFLRKFGDLDRSTASIDNLMFVIDNSETVTSLDPEMLILPLFYRLGFLDYATDLIMNRDKYATVVNLPYYTKSIIDNTLTPGFDIFNVARVANALSYIANDFPIPSKTDIIDSHYQSDMVTIYGEYYVIFGPYFSLFVIMILSYFFKKIYLIIKNENIFLFSIYRASILLIYYYWLNSFGIDWIARDIISISITLIIIVSFYKVEEKYTFVEST